MNFLSFYATPKHMMRFIDWIPEDWKKECNSQLRGLVSSMHRGRDAQLAEHCTEISMRIRDHWINRGRDRLGLAHLKTSFYVNCLFSADERMVSIDIPMNFDPVEDFYKIRFKPINPGIEGPSRSFGVEIFHTDQLWFAKLASWMAYTGEGFVKVDDLNISVKAWNALMALQHASGKTGFDNMLLDMAQDGVI